MIERVPITLISTSYTADAIGVQQPAETRVKRLGILGSVWQSERTDAATKGFTAEEVVAVWPFEYDGQKLAEFNGRKLEIYRTYLNRRNGRLELYLGQRVGVGGADNG